MAEIINSGAIRCGRFISQDGTVMVFPGQFVDPSMKIAFRKTWTNHFSINIYDALDLPSGCDIRDYLLINEGDLISINEPIARRDDKKKRTLTAKETCRFLEASSGNLIFESKPTEIETAHAGFPGVVAEIVPKRGAWIETTGGYIQGIWGNGQVGQGILLSLDMEKGGIFGAENISVDLAGSIIFANTCIDAKILRSSARMSPGGFIFGSLASDLLSVAMQLPFPVIVTDMIGKGGGISNPIHSVLGDNIIKCAYLYGVTSIGSIHRKPEIIIPQDEYVPNQNESKIKIEVGMRVRVLEGIYAGEIGYILEIIPADQSASGSKKKEDICDSVYVRLDEETNIILPINNIEIMVIK